MPIVLDGTAGITTPNVASTTSTLGPLTQALNLGSTGQIVFPATQNASANANTLDDYEEGTWTPTLTAFFNCSGLSVSSTWYVKIGGTVFYSIAGSVTVTSANTKTGFTFTQSFAQAVQSQPQGGSAVIEGPSPFPIAAGTAFNASSGTSDGFAAFGSSAVNFNGACFFSITGSFRAA